MRRRFTLLALLLAILVIVSSRASADETLASGAPPAPSPPRPGLPKFHNSEKLSIAHRAPPRASLAPGSDDADDASSARDEIGDGAVAMQAELDAMERVLVATREKLRALEESIDAQTVRLQAMRALSARPGVSCDESTDAAERLASALTLSARAARAGARAGDSHHRSSDPMDDPTDPDDVISAAGADDFGGLVMSSAAHLYANGGRAVAKRRDRWHDHLRLIAAVKIDRPITALAVMPQRGEHELSRYYAVGDDAGSVHVFRPDGDLALVVPPALNAIGVPVTYVHCALVRRNETLIVAGHADGAISFRVIAESGFDHRDDSFTNVVGDHPQTLSLVGDGFSFAMRDATPAAASARPARKVTAGSNGRNGKGANAAERERLGWRAQGADEVEEGRDGVGDGVKSAPGDGDGDDARCANANDANACSVHERTPSSGATRDEQTGWRRNPARVVAAEMFRIRDVRYVAVADASGKIAVFRVPTLSVTAVTHPSEWRLHLHSVHRSVDGVASFRQSPHYVAWAGASGAGAADVGATLEVLHRPCVNLNGTRIERLRFDAGASNGRFVGIGQNGELLAGVIIVDSNRATCVVRSVTRKNGSTLAPDSSLATIKGYAFVANPYDVTVLNTTVVGKKPPREVTSAPTEHLAAGFGRFVGQSELSDGPGLVASNRGRLVVVAFPDGLLASYESDLPTWRPAPMNTKLWSQPVFVAAMGLIGLWQFYRSRGHAAMGSSWGGPSVGKGGDGGGLDPKLLEQLMGGKDGGKGVGVGGGLGGGGRKAASSGDFGEGAMRRPGYANFDPAAFRAEMKKSGKWS